MEEGAKRRLVGTAVVVLLLVIFIPMLLDEKPPESLPDEDLTVPERPVVKPRTSDTASVPALSEPEVAPVPRELSTPPLSSPPPSAEPGTEPEGVRTAEPAAPEQPDAPVPAARRPHAAPTTPVGDKMAPHGPPTPGGVSSWIIQVASLSESKRAQDLERKLRAKGFPAFIEKAQVANKTFHRVRVGPEADRRRIEAMAASIKQKTGLSGQIQHYP